MKKQGNIYLIGFMGVGKTTVSKYLRELTGWEEVDTDKVIVRKKNMGIPEIFEKYGENYFRNLESHILEDYAKKGQRIVSCGGGIILRENNRRLMKKSGTVILLSATSQTIYENVKDGKDRPLLNGNMNPDYIGQMMQERQPYYEKAKDIEIVTDEKAPKDVAFEIIERLQIPMAGKEEEA